MPCVGAVIEDDDERLLLIRRGHAPYPGTWSLPGGHVEPGETDAEAVVREVAEETGLTVTAGVLIGAVQLPGNNATGYLVRDLRCTVTGGLLRAGDDADRVRWCTPADLADLPTTPGLLRTLAGWGVHGASAALALLRDRPEPDNA